MATAMTVAWLPALARATEAAPFPARTVRVIVPYPAGAAADAITRAIAARLEAAWGQPVIVENRPGLTTGTVAARQATPDGHTLLVGTAATMVTTPLTMPDPPYDVERDFAPISRLVAVTPVLAVQPSLPVKTLPQLVAFIRRHPNQHAYASSGVGGPSYLAMEQLRAATGMTLLHVGYKGAAQSLTDLVAGRVSMGFYALPSVLPFLRSGQLVAVGVAARQRLPALPDVPTIAETVPGFHYMLWYGLFAPAGTPGPVIARIGADVQRILKDPALCGLLAAQGSQPAPAGPEALTLQIRAERQAWARLIREQGIRID